MKVSIISIFLAGVLTFLSPCVLPLIPGYISYVSGLSLTELTSGGKNRRLVLIKTSLFVLGFSLTFSLMGGAAGLIGQLIVAYRREVMMVGGLILIIIGLNMLGLFKIAILEMEKRPSLPKPIGLMTPVLIGLIFAVGWTPCIGPILSSVLILAASTSSAPYGSLLLFIYSLGLGVPLIISSLAVDGFISLFAKYKLTMAYVKIISGIVMILVGVLFMLGKLYVLSF